MSLYCSKEKIQKFIKEERERAQKYDQVNVLAVLLALETQLLHGELDAQPGDGADSG